MQKLHIFILLNFSRMNKEYLSTFICNGNIIKREYKELQSNIRLDVRPKQVKQCVLNMCSLLSALLNRTLLLAVLRMECHPGLVRRHHYTFSLPTSFFDDSLNPLVKSKFSSPNKILFVCLVSCCDLDSIYYV